MRAFILLLCAVLAGCAEATTAVRIGGGGAAAAAPGTAASTATVGVYIGSGSAAGAVLGAGIVAGAIYGTQNGDDPHGGARVPPLDPNRAVLLQDCTQPIQDWSANLKCK